MVKKPGHRPGHRTGPAQTPEKESDRRRFLRVDLPLKARMLTAAGEEVRCLVTNVSAGGALLRSNTPPKFNEEVVLYIETLGRFEATVIRSDRNNFAVTYNGSRAKTKRTADALTEIKNPGNANKDKRNKPRYAQDAEAIVRLEDGRTVKCSIIDVSLTGASIEIHPRPPLGMHLILGRMRAKVVRRHDKGSLKKSRPLPNLRPSLARRLHAPSARKANCLNQARNGHDRSRELVRKSR
jgi:hypothetical protein